MTFTPHAPRSLLTAVTRAGVGLHGGDRVAVTLRPAAIGTGRRFVRVDLPDRPVIPATIAAVSQTQLSTELRAAPAGAGDREADRARVRTVEHLLAALAAANLSDVTIELDGAELPLLDGSARDWCAAIAEAGIVPIAEDESIPEPAPVLDVPISIQRGDASVTAIPSPEWRFSYGIDFEDAAIGKQWHSWSPIELGTTERAARDPSENRRSAIAILQDFEVKIGAARTFGLQRQIAPLQAAGLIRGGSLDNALVCDGERWLNPPLRFANEPVRHKILDLVGDLSLLGAIPRAHYIAYKASHALHVELARAICDRR